MSNVAPRGSSPPGTRFVSVEADLEVSVDGVFVYLEAHGDRLLLTTSHPHDLWRAVRRTSLPNVVTDVAGPRSAGRVGQSLAEAGLLLEVTGPHGVVVSLGRGVDSRLGRLTTGSASVRPGSPAAVAATTGALIGGRRAAAAAGFGALVLAVAIAVRRRRGERHPNVPTVAGRGLRSHL